MTPGVVVGVTVVVVMFENNDGMVVFEIFDAMAGFVKWTDNPMSNPAMHSTKNIINIFFFLIFGSLELDSICLYGS